MVPTSCLAGECEYAMIVHHQGSPARYCTKVKKGVINLLTCPENLWHKEPYTIEHPHPASTMPEHLRTIPDWPFPEEQEDDDAD